MSFRRLRSSTLAVSGVSNRMPIPTYLVRDLGGQGNVLMIGRQLRLQADGCDMFVKLGDSSVVASATDGFLLQDNAIESFNYNPDRDTHISAIQVSIGGTLKVDVGTSNSNA